MAKKIKPLKCPLCKEKSLQYELIKEKTHAWICEHCPAVLFEFLDDENSRHLHERLSEGKPNE